MADVEMSRPNNLVRENRDEGTTSNLFNSLVRGERNIMCFSPLTVPATSSSATSSSTSSSNEDLVHHPVPSFLIERPGDRHQSQRDAMVDFLRKNRGCAVRVRQPNATTPFRHRPNGIVQQDMGPLPGDTSFESSPGTTPRVVRLSFNQRLPKSSKVVDNDEISKGETDTRSHYCSSRESSGSNSSFNGTVPLLSCRGLNVRKQDDGQDRETPQPIRKNIQNIQLSEEDETVAKSYPSTSQARSLATNKTPAVKENNAHPSDVRVLTDPEEPPKEFRNNLNERQLVTSHCEPVKKDGDPESNIPRQDGDFESTIPQQDPNQIRFPSLEDKPGLCASTKSGSPLGNLQLSEFTLLKPPNAVTRTFHTQGTSSGEVVREDKLTMMDLSELFCDPTGVDKSVQRKLLDDKILSRTLINTRSYDMFARKPQKTNQENNSTSSDSR